MSSLSHVDVLKEELEQNIELVRHDETNEEKSLYVTIRKANGDFCQKGERN